MSQSTGTLRYSPKLIGKATEHYGDKWWAVLDCDPIIGEYYRNLYRILHNRCRTLLRPSWKEHITVIRDEEPPDEKKSSLGKILW